MRRIFAVFVVSRYLHDIPCKKVQQYIWIWQNYAQCTVSPFFRGHGVRVLVLADPGCLGEMIVKRVCCCLLVYHLCFSECVCIVNSELPIIACAPLPRVLPSAVELAGSISWLDGVKGDLNRALVSLGLVLHMSVVFINCCLTFFVLWFSCSSICFVHTSQLIVWEDWLLAPVRWLAGRSSPKWFTVCRVGC